MLSLKKVILCASVVAGLWACGDGDDNADPGGSSGGSGGKGGSGSGKGGTSNTAGKGGSENTAGKGGSENAAGKGGSGGEAGTPGAGGDTNPGVGGEPGEGGSGGEPPVSPYPQVPGALALSGCTNVGPICSVSQDEDQLTLNCGARVFTGTIQENGSYTLTGTPVTNSAGTTTTNTTCTGQVGVAGVVGTCDNTVSPPPASGSATTTCTLAVDTKPLPGISCLELPSEFSSWEFDTTDLGECKVIQNNCSFQADCDEGVVFGTVTDTGATFSRTLTAKAAAGAPEGTTPAFQQGAQISHSCTATLTGGALQGSCSAGAYSARGATPIPATSVYDFAAMVAVDVPVCSAIGPFTEKLFVLDSCEALKDGEGPEPGIGEPICAFQQNGCIWRVSCMTDPVAPLVFKGKLTPGQAAVDFQLSTGTPCEASFDANGNMKGKCTVPGQPACNLSSKAPAAANGCAQLSTSFTSMGCGNDSDGIPLDCRTTMQHVCDFAAICDFNVTRFPDTIFAGKASTEGGVDYLKFPGLGGRSCSVQRATDAEVADPANCRAPGEWYGDCLTPTGGGCANSFQCVADANGNYPAPTSNIRRGLRLWFD